MKPILFSTVLCAALVGGLLACSKKSSPPVRSQYFVKGDPKGLIKGATTNKHSPITEDNILEWNKYQLSSLAGFVQWEPTKTEGPTTKQELEKEQAPSEGPSHGSGTRVMQAVQDAHGWHLRTADASFQLDLRRESDGSLQIYQIGDGEKKPAPVHVIHWSESKDGSAVSVLMDFSTPVSGNGLLAVYFEKPLTQTQMREIRQTDSKYRYLAGPGRLIGWDPEESVTLNLCGAKSQTDLVSESLEKWTEYLQGRLNVEYAQTNHFAPFSDLNQHCVYFFDGYIFEQRSDAFTLGITKSLWSESRAKTVDSDVIIFGSEFTKMRNTAPPGADPARVQEVMDRTARTAVTHELGHWFGLDHKFDGTSSVMSYDFKTDTPERYDIEAIQALYPFKNAE
jgi:hypothetical protein